MSQTATLTAGLPPLPIPQGPPRQTHARAHHRNPRLACILAAYGRHLADTIEHAPSARGFATIAQFFGTVTIDDILAHIQRGLMRAWRCSAYCCAAPRAAGTCVILAPRAPPRAAARPPPTGAPDPHQPRQRRRQQNKRRPADAAQKPPRSRPRRGTPAASTGSHSCSTHCPPWRTSKPRSAAARSGGPSPRSAAISASRPRCARAGFWNRCSTRSAGMAAASPTSCWRCARGRRRFEQEQEDIRGELPDQSRGAPPRAGLPHRRASGRSASSRARAGGIGGGGRAGEPVPAAATGPP